MRKLAALLIALAIIAIGGLSAVAYVGVAQVPVLSAVFGMDKARDLGVKPDNAAWQKLLTDNGFQMPSTKANYTLSSKHSFSGSVTYSGTVSQETLNALPEWSANVGPVRDVSFRFHAGSVEVSAFADLSSYGVPAAGPVYGSFKVTKTGAHSVKIEPISVDFGHLPIPADMTSRVSGDLNSWVNGRLAAIPELSIETLTFNEGSVTFAGTLPKTYSADAPKAGQLP
jgi:hypothetical protein